MSDASSHWFWRYGYLVAVPVVLVIYWFSTSADRENQAHVNPAVFTFFEQVKKDCADENFDQQSDACRKIYLHKKDCKRPTSSCNSRSFYDFLVSLKYNAPPYFEAGYTPK